MDVLNQLCDVMVRGLDLLLGRLLWLPRDVTLLLVAIGTAVLMALARRAVTNRGRLQRCAQDLRQLKRLMRSAKQSRDKPQLQRLRSTQSLIKGLQLTADLKVLAAVVIPVAALSMWAAARLDFLPPRVGQDLLVRAYFPLSSIDGLAHLVPTSGIALGSPAIQRVRPEAETPTYGLAEWTLRPTAADDELVLTIRHHGESAEHRVAVGRPTYLPTQQHHPNNKLKRTEVMLPRYRPLGVNVKTETIGLPPWMTGYLVLTLLLVHGHRAK